MDSVELLQQIRKVIRETFAEFGGSTDQSLGEAMLIRDGFFCGRRFQCDGLHAVWFLEEHEIKFYDRNGANIRVLVLTPDNLDAHRREAA
jgi:hypothetical protein